MTRNRKRPVCPTTLGTSNIRSGPELFKTVLARRCYAQQNKDIWVNLLDLVYQLTENESPGRPAESFRQIRRTVDFVEGRLK